MTVAVTAYQAYKLVHIVAAIVWLGGGLAVSLLGMRVAQTADPRRLVGFLDDVEWVGNRVFAPAGLLVLVFGFLMIWEGPWTLDLLWLQLGLALFGVTFVFGLAFFGPESKRIAKAVERDGPESPEAQHRIRRILLVSRLDLLTLYSIAVVMVAKPTADDTLLFVLWGASLVVLASAFIRAYRSGQGQPGPALAPAE